MVVIHRWDSCRIEDHEKVDVVSNEIKTDQPIDIRGVYGFGLERLSDGGLKFKYTDEDEFGNESVFEVVLSSDDINQIKEFEKNGFI